jgi:hypothetical protein
VEGILDAQRTILGTVFEQQLLDTEAGVPLSARVALDRLSKADRAQLRSALRRVDEAVELVAEGRV